MIEPNNLVSQDCINVPINNGKPVWFRFTIHETGMLALSIEIPKVKSRKIGNKNFYPEFRYFLSRRNE